MTTSEQWQAGQLRQVQPHPALCQGPTAAGGCLLVADPVSQPLHFVAQQPPGFKPGEPVLVAQGVRFTQMLKQSSPTLKVGDTLTRQLTLQADGALAMALPAPSLGEVDGLKRYPKTPQVSNLDDGRGRLNGASYRPVFSIAQDLKQLGQQGRFHLSRHWLMLGALLAILATALAICCNPGACGSGGRYRREPSDSQVLPQLKQSLATLQDKAVTANATHSSTLRPLNPGHDKDFS